MGWKRPLFALATLLLFFGIVEGILWAGGVDPLVAERDPFQGFSERVRVYERSSDGERWSTAPRAVRHSFNQQEFTARKPSGALRVFSLGGSDVYGFPWGAPTAFPALLGRALSATWPGRKVESINAAAMSYGSHRLRILTHELLEHEPDVLVVFSGHNEFVESRFYADLLERPRVLDPARGLLHHWRLYALATRAWERWAAPDPAAAEATRSAEAKDPFGLDVVREYSNEVAEAERTAAVTRFTANLGAILDEAERAGVRVVLCTVPSNLRDWQPNQSFFADDVPPADREVVLRRLGEARAALDAGSPAAAAATLELARALAPGYAEVHFLLGRAYEGLERWDEAREAYVRARDSDGRPARAISALNDAIRRLSDERGVPLFDAEREFAEAARHGIPGFDLFEDYVHPKPAAHRRIAYGLWRLFLERGIDGTARAPDPALFRAAVGEIPAAQAGEESAPVAATEASTPPLLFNLAVVLENQGLHDEAMDKYRACVALDPSYHVAWANLGRLLLERDRPTEAVEAYRSALATDPDHVRSLVGLGNSLIRLGQAEPAREALARAVQVDPRSAPAWDALAGVLVKMERPGEAEAAWEQAVELDPDNDEVHANIGFARFFQRRFAEAEASFRRALELAPAGTRGRDGLAAVQIEHGRLDEAERLFRESLEIDPRDDMARRGLVEIEKRRSAAGTRR